MTVQGQVFDTDVVVVGAGAAGIAAAMELRAAGLSVLCIEAADRIGGRTHTDTAIFGLPFDMGAHWLHNEHVNALKAPGLALGLDLYPAPDNLAVHGMENPDALWDEADAIRATLMAAAREDSETEKRTGQPTDRSLADIFVAKNPWSLTAMMTHGLSPGRDLSKTSLRDMADWEGGKDFFCRQGFGHLLALTAQGLPVTLATPVTEIAADVSGVRVKTTQGEIRARAVIVTVSIGVLAEDLIRFDPPLDLDRRRALDYVTLGDYNHVALQFQTGSIPLEADTWLTYQLAANAKGEAQGGGFLCNISGTGLTSFESAGSFSRDLQAAGPKAAIDHALGVLAGIFGTDIRRDFIKGHATNWRAEPFVRGSYSGVNTGGHGQRAVLARPHAQRVHFAGEASHTSQPCSTSGANLEGLRAARDVIAQLGQGQNPGG